MNFQMFKLYLERAEKPEIKLPTATGSSKKQESSRKHLFYWLCQSLRLCGSQQTMENSERDGNPRPLDLHLRNLYAGQEAIVTIEYGTTDWFKIGKGIRQGCILSPCLFNLYAEYIMQMLGWMKRKLESRLPGEISITSVMQMTSPLWHKVQRN